MLRYYEGQLTHFAEEDVEQAEESEVKVTEVAEKVVFYNNLLRLIL